MGFISWDFRNLFPINPHDIPMTCLYDFHPWGLRQVTRSTRLDEVMKGSQLETLRLMTLRTGEALSSPGALGWGWGGDFYGDM